MIISIYKNTFLEVNSFDDFKIIGEGICLWYEKYYQKTHHCLIKKLNKYFNIKIECNWRLDQLLNTYLKIGNIADFVEDFPILKT